MRNERPLLVSNCGQLLTLRGSRHARRGAEMEQLEILKRGAVLIKEGVIAMVGSARSVERSPGVRKAVQVDAKGGVVMPGFVDSHTHALFAAPRLEEYVARIRGASYEDIARIGGGIQTSARQMRSARPSVLGMHLNSAVRRGFQYGTTTIEVKSGYGLEPAQELKMLRIIRGAARHGLPVVPTLLIHDVPARLRTDRARFIKLVADGLIPEAARRGAAEFCDVFCDRGYFSVEEARTILTAASRHGLKPKLHAEQLTHSGGAAMAAELRAVSVDHLDHVRDGDMARLRAAGTIATLLPGSVLYLGSSKYPPARRLIDNGVPVALASNFNPGSSPTLNVQLVLSLACSQMRMTPAEAITAATINGAHALARGDRTGSLEEGKAADLVIMDVSDYREIPYYLGMNHCVATIQRGRVVHPAGWS